MRLIFAKKNVVKENKMGWRHNRRLQRKAAQKTLGSGSDSAKPKPERQHAAEKTTVAEKPAPQMEKGYYKMR